MAIQTQTISVQEARERLPDLLEMARFHGQRFIIQEGGAPIAILGAAEGVDLGLDQQKKSEHPYIGRVAGVCGGEPIILGTRISIARVVELFEDSDSIDEILEALPLTPAQVHDALSYYYDHREEIGQILEQRRLENVLKRHNLVLEEVVEGVYQAHAAGGRW